MTESNKQSNLPQAENNGLALQIFKEACCESCSCMRESEPIKETDAMGREKFWEDLGRPND